MVEIDYESMTVDELNAELLAHSNRLDALRAEALAIRAIRDHKAASASAKAKLATMTDTEKAALLQELRPHPIGADS